MYWEVAEVQQDSAVPTSWHCMGWVEVGGERVTSSVTYSFGEPPLLQEAEDKMELILLSQLLEIAVGLYDKAYPDHGKLDEMFVDPSGVDKQQQQLGETEDNDEA